MSLLKKHNRNLLILPYRIFTRSPILTAVTTPLHAISTFSSAAPHCAPLTSDPARLILPLTCAFSQLQHRAVSSLRKMASDEDYMSFLNKANEDVSGSQQQQQQAATTSKASKHQFKTQDEGSDIPKEIQDVCNKGEVYTSEADEPFQPVSLKWDGEDGLPDEVEFAKLIQHWDPEKADISILDPTDWDTKGQYGDFIDAVRDATKGNDVRVYRVVKDKTRVDYWVISRAQGKIVGVKALGVES